MSLWGVRVVMGSALESLGTSFWDPLGVILGALGYHFGSFLGHFWSLGGSFWELFGSFLEPWGVIGRLFGRLGPDKKLYTPRIDSRRILLGS